MPRAWSDFSLPAAVPADSFIFFGPTPHTRASEPGDPTSQRFDSCERCGGAHRDKFGRVTPNRPPEADPVKDYEVHVSEKGGKASAKGATRATPLVAVCGLCNRSPHDGTAAMLTATKPGDGESNEGFEDLGPIASKGGAGRDANAPSDPPPAPTTPSHPAERPLTRKERRAGMARKQGA